ncbi:MAG: FAD-binding oxidoreductase [Acidobacteria bacterium]|nr:FAD-binding oxidoreductase [Acidobacteriota bacterium]
MTIEDASGYSGECDRRESPSTVSEVAALLKEASSSGMPVTLLGAGSGVTGGGVPSGGLALSLEKFRHLEISKGAARAGAGLLLYELQNAAKSAGQFYAPDPTHNSAALGGTIANNASGSRSFRYGSTRRHVESLLVALADGTVREFARGDTIDFDVPAVKQPQTNKHQAGYPLRPGMDWVDLFCGSEGTLGVVLEATFRLLPARGPLLSGVVFFASEAQALDAVDVWRPLERLQMLEYVDAKSLELIDGPRYGAALLIEEENPDEEAWVDRLEAAGAMIDESWFGTTDGDRERFRKFRHALPEKVNDTVRRRGSLKMGTDYAVPVDRNREMIGLYRKGLSEYAGDAVIYGHIGDGHPHVNLMPSGEVERNKAWELIHTWAHQAVSLGGTVGAEHGLGKRKKHLLEIMYSPEDLAAMRSVKSRLDPGWILGRGTLFDAPA